MADIRIGDDDRQLAIDRLNAAYGEGRIDLGELEHRLEVAHKAKFPVELNTVVEDLPGGVAIPENPPIELQAEPIESEQGSFDFTYFREEYGIFVAAPIICSAIYAMTDFGGYFWPMWVWFGCLAIMLIGVISGE